MSLAHALVPGYRPQLPAGPPYPCAELGAWVGLPFTLPPGDDRLPALHAGGPASSPPLDNLVGAVRAWREHPEWMDFLDPAAPNHQAKVLERALYEHIWGAFQPAPGRALDLGGGIGRFTQPLVYAGWDVDLVDPDLRALRRALAHCVGAPGRLDLHWSTGERLPELRGYDLAIAAEVLCYAEDPAAIVAALHERLRPGGVLFCSVEARWGWAMSPDVAPGTLPALLAGAPVHVPGDRFVRTFEAEELRLLLQPFELLALVPTHYVSSGPFELSAGELNLTELISYEQALRAHPQTAALHRAWTAVARRKM